MKPGPISLASDFSFPSEVVTETIAILGKRGAGKTSTAVVVAEGMIEQGLPVVVLDPTGVWWGLRASRDGRGEGLPVNILGGEHGDLPLTDTVGKVVAELVVDHPGAYVLDLSTFDTRAAQDRFVTAFAERLYRYKATRREPLHLMVDEADAFAPQRPQPGQQKMLGAWESIVRRGRSRGLGVTLITQRAASLNKNVLTQTECLILLQTTGPQDKAAVKDWIAGNADADQQKQVMDSLAGLRRGQAWIWSPSWLRSLDLVQIGDRTTFDSSGTPEVGGDRIEPKRLASVDLEAIETAMADTIERAKADDPKALRARIAEKDRQIRALVEQATAPLPEVVEVPVEVPFVPEDVRTAATDLVAHIRRFKIEADEIIASLTVGLADAGASTVAAMPGATPEQKVRESSPTQRIQGGRQPRRTTSSSPPAAESVYFGTGDPDLPAPERKILTALAQSGGEASKKAVALLAQYAHSGGSFNNALGRLRTKGFITPARVEPIGITPEGYKALGSFDDRPTGMDLLAYWVQQPQIKKAESLILNALFQHPDGLTKEMLAEETEYEASGGSFNNSLGRLRTLGLITPARVDPIALDEEFFA